MDIYITWRWSYWTKTCCNSLHILVIKYPRVVIDRFFNIYVIIITVWTNLRHLDSFLLLPKVCIYLSVEVHQELSLPMTLELSVSHWLQMVWSACTVEPPSRVCHMLLYQRAPGYSTCHELFPLTTSAYCERKKASATVYINLMSEV